MIPTTANAHPDNKQGGIVEVLNALLANSVRISSQFVTADESAFNPASPKLDPEIALNNLCISLARVKDDEKGSGINGTCGGSEKDDCAIACIFLFYWLPRVLLTER